MYHLSEHCIALWSVTVDVVCLNLAYPFDTSTCTVDLMAAGNC